MIPPETLTAAQAGDRDALAAVFEAIEPYVKNAVKALSGTHIDPDDLKQDARLAAMRALNTYNPAKGSFETYLYRYARGYVLERAGQYYLGVPIPHAALRRYWSAINSTNTVTEAKEAATDLADITFDHIHNIITGTVPFAAPRHNPHREGREGASDDPDDSASPVGRFYPDFADDLAERLDLTAVLDVLNPRERIIIEAYTGWNGSDTMTDKEISNLIGVSRSRVTRLRQRATEKLRQAAKAMRYEHP